MKKQPPSQEKTDTDDMLPEYDFSKGVRGKHYRAMEKGYTVRIHNEDGTTTVQYFVPSRSTIVLDADVLEHYPDSKSVNRQLRACISEKRVRSTARRGPTKRLAPARSK